MISDLSSGAKIALCILVLCAVTCIVSIVLIISVGDVHVSTRAEQSVIEKINSIQQSAYDNTKVSGTKLLDFVEAVKGEDCIVGVRYPGDNMTYVWNTLPKCTQNKTVDPFKYKVYWCAECKWDTKLNGYLFKKYDIDWTNTNTDFRALYDEYSNYYINKTSSYKSNLLYDATHSVVGVIFTVE